MPCISFLILFGSSFLGNSKLLSCIDPSHTSSQIFLYWVVWHSELVLPHHKTILFKPKFIKFQFLLDFSPFCFDVRLIRTPVDIGNSSLSLVRGQGTQDETADGWLPFTGPHNDQNFRTSGCSYQFYMSTFLLYSQTPSLTSWGNSKGDYWKFSVPDTIRKKRKKLKNPNKKF